MKQFIIALLAGITLCSGAEAQRRSIDQKMKRLQDEIALKENIAKMQKEAFDVVTLDKMADLSTLTGKTLCLRPDYKNVRSVKPLVYRLEGHNVIAKDALTVTKAKKSEITVEMEGEKMKILKTDFPYFLLTDQCEEIVARTTAEAENQQKQQFEKERQEEEAKQQAEWQENLKKYREQIANLASSQEGPIAVETSARDYDGTIPYWRYFKQKYNGKTDTFLDEKFMIQPLQFNIPNAMFKDKNNHFHNQSTEDFEAMIESVKGMLADTFGILKLSDYHYQMINLRTGQLVPYYNQGGSSTEWTTCWESTEYLDKLHAAGKTTYDGSYILQDYIFGNATPFREQAIEALKGEKVFFLDSLKYDVITDIEQVINDNQEALVILHLEKRGTYPFRNTFSTYGKAQCISVKWYEQLQKMKGQKVFFSNFFDQEVGSSNEFYKENMKNCEPYTLEKLEVKDHKLIAMLGGSGEKAGKELEATDVCRLLAAPIDYEKDLEPQGRARKWDNLLPYDYAMANIPAKPESVKKEEAEWKASTRAASEKFAKLREHKYVGAKRSEFLKDWPYAKLISTSSAGLVTIRVYSLPDVLLKTEYLFYFENETCVSQQNR